MSNAILYVILSHTPRTPYTICNYFPIWPKSNALDPILSHVVSRMFGLINIPIGEVGKLVKVY